LEEKDKEELGSCSLENGSVGYLVSYLEGEKLTEVLGQSPILARLQAILFEIVVWLECRA